MRRLENIQNRRFFISRDIIVADFIISKNSKLPPSLESVFKFIAAACIVFEDSNSTTPKVVALLVSVKDPVPK